MLPSKQQAPALSPFSPGRDQSPELGSPSKTIAYNQQTGRPVRQSAGKRERTVGFVDPNTIDEEDGDEDSGPATTDESDNDMSTPARSKRARAKRKRSPSPPSPPLPPIIHYQEPCELTDDEGSGTFHQNTPKKPQVTMQFNVPLGFHGPLFVKLDSKMLECNEEVISRDMEPPQKNIVAGTPKGLQQNTPAQHKGFQDLPPELRNTIYRLVFVRKASLRIPQIPNMYLSAGLCLSSQFLRTCKTVHDEGCSILYGENTFLFDRHQDTRAPFWETKLKEIGYQDVLQFLKMIGPENIQYLRDVQFNFDDALAKNTPASTNEERRLVTDEYLLSCLRILRDAKLRKFRVEFFPRRQISKLDVRFLSYLAQIQADEVVNLTLGRPYTPQKISPSLWRELESRMVRKRKLYQSE